MDKTEIDANSESDEEGIYAYPFIEKGDLIPVKEYKTWKMVNDIPEYRIGSGDILNIRFWIGLNEKRIRLQYHLKILYHFLI